MRFSPPVLGNVLVQNYTRSVGGGIWATGVMYIFAARHIGVSTFPLRVLVLVVYRSRRSLLMVPGAHEGGLQFH